MLVAVLTLGIPLGVVAARLIDNQAHRRVERDARNVAVAVEERLDDGMVPSAARLHRLAPADTEVTVSGRGQTVRAGPRLTGAPLTATVHTPQGFAVQAATARGPVRAHVAEALAVVGGLALLSIALGIGLAVAMARRLSRPLVDLEVSAAQLGGGDFRAHAPRSGVPEIDRVAAVLDASGAKISELLRRERQFASDASHQLRTPLTALQMRLDEIAHTDSWQTVREEADAALGQAERLTGVIEHLLAAARHSRAAAVVPTDVAATVSALIGDWSPAYRGAGRALGLAEPPAAPLVALSAPGTLAQALSTLLDNALRHGGGDVTARARGAGEYVRVDISDEGPGVPEELIPRLFERSVSGNAGTGLGLALARALVEADGGRIELVAPRPATFAVFLPRDRPGPL